MDWQDSSTHVATLTLLTCLSALGRDALLQDQGISGLVQKLMESRYWPGIVLSTM